MRLCIQGGLVINPKTKQEEVTSLWIEDGKVVAFGESQGKEADQIIDATGKWVVPGLIDMHVHF